MPLLHWNYRNVLCAMMCWLNEFFSETGAGKHVNSFFTISIQLYTIFAVLYKIILYCSVILCKKNRFDKKMWTKMMIGKKGKRGKAAHSKYHEIGNIDCEMPYIICFHHYWHVVLVSIHILTRHRDQSIIWMFF